MAQEIDESTFVFGSAVSFTDFIIVGVLQSLLRINVEMFERFVSQVTGFGSLYNACSKWLEKDQ